MLELAVSGYTLAYAFLLVTSARLGEARGCRRVFLLGVAIFTVCSLACGLAPDAPALVLPRFAAGAGAALMAAQVLTGIQRSFSGPARTRALGWVRDRAVSRGGRRAEPGRAADLGHGVPGPVLGRLPARLHGLAAPAGSALLAAGFGALATALFAGDTGGPLLMTLLGGAGLGLGISFTGMLKHLTSSVTGRHAADISGLFNTTTRVGGVIGVAVFGTLYFALVPRPGASPAVHGFAITNVALAATALAATVAAAASARHQAE